MAEYAIRCVGFGFVPKVTMLFVAISMLQMYRKVVFGKFYGIELKYM